MSLTDEQETEVARSIRLPQKIWDALEADAKRCKRSAVKQLEALLTKLYLIDDVEIHLNHSEISDVSSANSPDSSHQSSQPAGSSKRSKST